VTAWMAAMEALGQQLLVRDGAGPRAGARRSSATAHADPTVLFRIFRYPPHPDGDTASWGVGEHTDYGLLTLLATTARPGCR
jgi:isopenicillin N synthase-like dioxygenase